MFKNFQLKEVYVRWTGIAMVALIMMLLYKRPDQTYLQKYPVAFIFTSFFWNGAFMLFMKFRRVYPQIKQTPKRLVITMFWLAILLIIGDPLLSVIFGFEDLQTVLDPTLTFDRAPTNFLAAFVVGSIYENVYFFEQWKKSIQLNEALKNQQIRTQLEVLQNQMSPHFLFNSLNTLTTLIAEDGNVAIEFTERLSEVYRYILQNKEKEVVKLQKELDFAKNYIFLLKIRYPENLNVRFNVEEKYLEESIAPLTIQILLENAIKHNRISKTHPLDVDIYVDSNKTIVVKNNLQKRNVIEKSTKTGLANIKKRYAYFGYNSIQIKSTTKTFLVAIPLLHIKNDTEKVMNPTV